jgi:phosphopantothenoylcysteine decarboxylase
MGGTANAEAQRHNATKAAAPNQLPQSDEHPEIAGEAFTRRPRVLLAVSGSVATVKCAAIAELLLRFGDVRVITTSAARHFLAQEDLPTGAVPLLTDEDEWASWQRMGDPVLHIELRRWGDALVVAPLSANTLAKLANGLCDNLLTCVMRAWDFKRPFLVSAWVACLLSASSCQLTETVN